MGERNGSFCLGRARGWRKICKLIIKWASSSKTVSKDSANTSFALTTGCFLDTIAILNRTTKKKHIFEYVCKTYLKELAINTGKPLKNIAASNIFKKSAIFLPYFFKQVTPIEHLPMVISGNVTKYAYYTNLNNIYMVYWLIMVVPVKFLSWLNSYVNS